jgi:hypothetical protein
MPIQLTGITLRKTRRRWPIEDITDDIRTAVAEALEFCTENPGKGCSAQFDTVQEGEDFLYGMNSYAYHATPRLTVSGNVTTKGEVRFTVKQYGYV